MTTEVVARTNQLLGLAQYQLRRMLEGEEASASSPLIARQAGVEALLFHLRLALNSYYCEVAERSNLPVNQISDHEALFQLFTDQNKHSAELTEIQVLVETQNSWLHTLLNRYQQCWVPKVSTQARVSMPSSQSEISLTEVSSEARSFEELQTIHTELSELIHRQRQSMQEW